MDINTTVALNNGVNIPVIGLGVFQSPGGGVTKQAILDSLEAGYRHIDTARIMTLESESPGG